MDLPPLVATSILFVIPLLVFRCPAGLALLLCITALTSILFWSNPVKNSRLHRVDAVFSKLAIGSFIMYKLLVNTKNQAAFFATTTAMLVCFYISNRESTKEWGADTHIFAHIMAHLLATVSICIALTETQIITPYH